MEELMQYIWQFRLWPSRDMKTVDGLRVLVLDPGVLNRDAGPDFFNAKVIIGEREWVGNVEIHVKASDWYRHHHDTDPAYDSVVLHVVECSDMLVYRDNGMAIPQMIMRCDPNFSVKYHRMVNNPTRELPCADEICSVPRIYIDDWLTALGFERLYNKADRIQTLLDRCNGDWAETIYITLARALGFSTNSDPFELLASTTPLRVLLHHADSLLTIEAILFGQAGMLERLDTNADPYIYQLVAEYRFMQVKYGLKPSSNIVWKMARMRPQNFPHRRIAALAKYIHEYRIFHNALLEIKDEEAARKLLNIELDGYWARHYNFNAATPIPIVKALSTSSITVLLINVVAPLIFAYATSTGNEQRREFAIDLLHKLRPESNRIIETFIQARVVPSDAFATQAMIQLKRQYCESRKCIFCRIGHRLLSIKATRMVQ